MNNTIIFSSSQIELSEHKTYIELSSRLCWYGYPNANGVLLPIEGAEEKAATLVNQPVVAFYKKDFLGRDDLGGHEMSIDKNGQAKFGTENIGVNISVEVRNDDVVINGEVINTPCLFAVRRVWKRNKNVVNAIKRLYAEGKLSSSWEVIVSEFVFKNGIKELVDYTFEADALLGSAVCPAFSCAKTFDISEYQLEEMAIAEALANDINITLKEQEDNNLAKVNKNEKDIETSTNVGTEENDTPVVTESNVSTSTVDTEDSMEKSKQDDEDNEKDKSSAETSELTEWDLRRAIEKACRLKTDRCCWVFYHFPTTRTVWVQYEGRKSELDYMIFTYEVEGDVVTVSEPQEGKLAVNISEINSIIAAKDLEISQKNETLIKANEKIVELQAEVSSLLPYKESCEKAERERIEAEISEKRTELSIKMAKSKLFTDEELESSEIKALIDRVDETAIRNIMADKLMANLSNEDTNTVETSETQVSEAQSNISKANIDSDYSDMSFSELMEVYTNKK